MIAVQNDVCRHSTLAEESVPLAKARRKAPRSPVLRIGLWALMVALLCLGYVAQRVALMQLTYQLDAETARLRAVAQEHEYLRLQVARARSLDRIEAIARGRLGMQSPGHRDVVVIPSTQTAPTQPAAYSSPSEEVAASEGWLAALMDWASHRWPGNAAEAGRIQLP
mgnify:CR=1 FL=1